MTVYTNVLLNLIVEGKMKLEGVSFGVKKQTENCTNHKVVGYRAEINILIFFCLNEIEITVQYISCSLVT